MGEKSKHKVWRIIKRVLLTLLIIIVIIPVLLYLPFVQDFIASIAVDKVSQATGWEVSLDRFRMRFPLKVELDGLCISDEADTLIAASEARVDVSALNLLRGRIVVDEARLTDGLYRLGTADSAMYLVARIDNFTSMGTSANFSFDRIDVGPTALDGARIDLNIKDTITAPTPPDTAPPAAMLISATELRLTDVDFRMRMLPTIDTLQTYIDSARVDYLDLDMSAHSIHAALLSVGPVKATYLTPSEEFLADYKSPAATDSTALPPQEESVPWTITADNIRLSSPEVLYGVAGARPQPGLDLNRLRVDSITVEIDSFYNRATDLRVPLTRLSASLSGTPLTLDASGLFTIDSVAMGAHDFLIATTNSRLNFDALMGLDSIPAKTPIELKANGFIGMADVSGAMPALSPMLRGFAPDSRLELEADINGTLASLDVERIHAAIPSVLTLSAEGHIDNPTDFNTMSGQIDLDGQLTDGRAVASALPAGTLAGINLAPMAVTGNVIYRPGVIDGDVRVNTAGGNIALNAFWNQKAEGYDATLNSRSFPLQRFMPSLGVANVTGTLSVKGHGYDPARRSTSIHADARLTHMLYNGQSLDGLTIKADLDTCRLTAHIISDSPDANIEGDLKAWFTPDGYDWDLGANLRNVDLQALKVSETPMGGSAEIYSSGTYNPRTGAIDAEAQIDRLHWRADSLDIDIPSLTAKFSTADTLTHLNIVSGAFTADISSPTGLDSIMAHVDSTTVAINRIIDTKSADIIALQHALPPLRLTASSSAGDPVAVLARRIAGAGYKSASLEASTDSLIDMHAVVATLTMGSTRIDELTLDAVQKGRFLQYDLKMDNHPGTMDDFAHVDFRGFLSENKFAGRLSQSNIQGEKGFIIGMNTTLTDSVVTLHLAPYNPTIAYKQWTINRDNEISYNFDHHHIDANLKLMSDSSSLHLYTEHVDSLADHQEDVVLKMKNIALAEWLSISPFSPPIKGTLGADMRFRWDESNITGQGTLSLDKLYYGRELVGSFEAALELSNNARTGAIYADASLLVDGQKVITARGNLNDSTAVHPFLLDFSMIHFPLRTINPFIGKDVAQLSGMLNGNMDITGTLAEPIFNGSLQFDSTAVKVAFTGASYGFSPEPVPVDSNIVKFKDFYISGLNNQNLLVNGTVDARRISDIALDLSMKARNMQIVNSNRPRGANLYGKGFIDLDAQVRGNMNLIVVNADLNILSGTNVTYVLTESQQSLAAPKTTDDMVRFVNFSDTSQVARIDSIQPSAFAMILDANLTISEGSTINVDLSTDGKNRVQINGSGDLSYTMSPANPDGRLTGRYTINSGFVRYTPQISTGGYSMSIMSEKNFKFTPGSYVAFTGPVLNPTLSINAVDRMRANVTQEGQNSRLVNFDVGVSVGGTLEDMKVSFDLSTDDDITIQNELQGMSPDQRANQAMNMLLYNQYTGPGTKANANLSGNPLYSFLASQLNSWAANNIRGVDISFGVDQYDTTTDGSRSTTTSYSYRVSKTLFNDRFKIVVGGNYSTDADADENFSQNLINDISFEYLLNRAGSMYVRLFRHVGFESILEGEITQTGVGFVMKRKINSLRDLFRFSPAIRPSDTTVNEK
ncbi:MAG: translocation/assembly module TamB [Paramuribaculum sp.]|nr:translocation/assembly module TamB [Paramuribaculum sp.]